MPAWIEGRQSKQEMNEQADALFSTLLPDIKPEDWQARIEATMSPDEIIGRLKKGNENYVSNNLTQRDHSAQRRKATIGQYPKAIVSTPVPPSKDESCILALLVDTKTMSLPLPTSILFALSLKTIWS